MSREVPEYECEQCRGMSDERPCPRCAAIDKHSEKRYTAADLAAAESAAYKRGLLRGAEMTNSRCDCNCCCYNADAIKEEAEKP